MPSHNLIPGAADGLSDRHLQTPVRDCMRPGVIAISGDASLRQAERAMVRHGVHAILVLGRTTAKPAGWVTSRGMLPWVGHDLGLIPASAGVTEAPTSIEADLRGFLARNLDLDDDRLRHLCEQAIRNYDPCISCATHFLTLEVDRG